MNTAQPQPPWHGYFQLWQWRLLTVSGFGFLTLAWVPVTRRKQ